MATYNRSMAVKQMIYGMAGNQVTGGNVANYSNALLYTCPANVLFTRYWTLAANLNTVPSAPVVTLTVKASKPDAAGNLTRIQTLLTFSGSSGPAIIKDLHSKMGPNIFDLNTYNMLTDANINAESGILLPGEQLLADMVDGRGYLEAGESCYARYLLMEISNS